MAHAQKTDFVVRRNGRVHLNRRGRQFSWLLRAEVCASAVVMLDTPCSEVVWRVLAAHSFRQFPLHFPSRASPCAITFQLDSTTRPRPCRHPSSGQHHTFLHQNPTQAHHTVTSFKTQHCRVTMNTDNLLYLDFVQRPTFKKTRFGSLLCFRLQAKKHLKWCPVIENSPI
jgi:hypothetical protein